MRTWTLAFLSVATLAVLAGMAGFETTLSIATKVLLLVAVFAALVGAIRSAASRPMMDGGPGPATYRATRCVGGRRRDDPFARPVEPVERRPSTTTATTGPAVAEINGARVASGPRRTACR